MAGWQDLKTDSGDIADLTPRARQDPPALRTTHFQEGEDDEDWHTRITYDMQQLSLRLCHSFYIFMHVIH
jgi:hypothetical protein